MKNPIRIFAFAGFMLLTSGAYSVNNLTYHVTMLRIDTQGNKNPDNRKGDRSNRRPLIGEITSSGVNIPGVENSEIISFEIYDLSGICMGIYSAEMDFVNALFSLSGEFEIRFVTDEAAFAGTIEL